jgi:hypothetical protein
METMSEVTYGRLDQVLRAFGFSVRLHKGDEFEGDARIYRHPGGAILPLPAFPDDQMVSPLHLAAARVTLDNFGIASPLDFAARLQKAS